MAESQWTGHVCGASIAIVVIIIAVVVSSQTFAAASDGDDDDVHSVNSGSWLSLTTRSRGELSMLVVAKKVI